MAQILSDLLVFASSLVKDLKDHGLPSSGNIFKFLSSIMSAKQPGYQYQNIPDKESIRMLLLEPGNLDEPLEGTLEFVNIDNAGIYEPLSYVWSQPGPSDTSDYTIVLLEDNVERSLKLTGSLYGALKRLRLPDRKRRVWADQICINQKDDDEKSEQIKFMNKIYKNASHVLVWLGLDEEKLAESAFQLIHQLDKAFKDEEQHKELNVAYTKDLEDQIEKERRALDHLIDLPWVCWNTVMPVQTPPLIIESL
jgi:hypothetical protein